MNLCAPSLTGGFGHLWKSKKVMFNQSWCWKLTTCDSEANEFGSKWCTFEHKNLDVKAYGRKKKKHNHGGNDPFIPDEDSESESANKAFDGIKFDCFHQAKLDWRTFRANLVAQEQVQPEFPQMGTKWAHTIAALETGCVLIATEKLDGVRNFERTVILLLRLGTRDPREGPIGIILNRPLNKKIEHTKPIDATLATTFAHCRLHFGGPLHASVFLLSTDKTTTMPNLEQVIPGVCFGAKRCLSDATKLVKRGIVTAQDFGFFVGYAGWQLEQLVEEIESEYWIVAACSSDLINSALPDESMDLWKEILLLMGGRYSELGRKPRGENL